MESLWSDSFVLFTKINVMVSELTDAEVAQLFRAILYYQSTGKEPENLDRIVSVVFAQVKADMDYCKTQREAKVKQKKDAGKKSAESRSANTNTVEHRSTPLNTVEHRSTPFNDNGDGNGDGNETEDENIPLSPFAEEEHPVVNKKPKLTKAEKNERLLTRIRGDTEGAWMTPLEEKLHQWMRYKGDDKKFEFKETGLKAFLSKVDSYVAQYGENAVADAINTAMASGWQGIVWEKIGAAKPQYSQPDSRDWENA